jgi:N-acetylmuramoyl-L-alanine amidase
MTDEVPVSWKKAQALSAIIASVLIPAIIGLVGHMVNQSIKKNELSLRYVQLAVGILENEPKPGTENLRVWAIEVVNEYSETELSDDVQQELRKNSLISTRTTDPNPLSERAESLRMNGTDDGLDGQTGPFQVRQHVLLDSTGQPVPVVETPNLSGKIVRLRFVVLHFTAEPTLEGALRRYADPGARASVHLLIDREGGITQLVPFDFVAWHAGSSSWRDVKGLNDYSIGISFVNAGALTRKGDQWVAWYGGLIPDSEVYIEHDASSGEETAWQKYTRAQIVTAMTVIPEIVAAYPSIEEILSHSEITAQGRKKRDPGPAFPIEELRQRCNEVLKERSNDAN